MIYVEKIKKDKFSLKQVPKINGGIVVMNPYTGRVLALSGGFSFKNSEFNRASQALRGNQVQLLNLSYMHLL